VVSKLSFDDIPELAQLPRPDYLLVLDDGEVVVVEETGRPKPEDLERVIEAVVGLKRGELNLPIETTPPRITGVVHFRRRDLTFGKHLSGEQKRLRDKHGIILLGVSCDRELRQRLRVTFGKGK